MYRMTRRDFLKTFGSPLLLGYLPVFKEGDISAQAQKPQSGYHHHFEGYIKFYLGFFQSFQRIGATLETRLSQDSYFSEFKVFDSSGDEQYLHMAVGNIVGHKLLPNKVEIRRNFDSLWIRIVSILSLKNYVRKDKFMLDFKDDGVNQKMRYNPNIPDLLTVILQTFLNLKREAYAKSREVQIVDKLGNPKTAFIEIGNDSTSVNFKEPFDLKRMTIRFDNNFEPLEVKIEGLYDIADLEASRKPNIF